MNGRSVLAMVSLLAGCSSGNFDIGAEGVDAAGSDSAAAETELVDSGSSPGDSSSPPGDVGCTAVADPLEVFVDASSTFMAPTGSTACPFAHITDAIAYVRSLPVKPRTIRVREGAYVEGPVILEKGMTLAGAGASKTTISGGGTCMGTGSAYLCIVRVDGGAILDGVSIDAGPSGKHGVITGSTSGSTYPIVRNTSIGNAVGDGNAGILAMEGAILGPNIVSSKNRYGLVIWGNQTVKVLAGNNHFDENTNTGIDHEGTGVFSFEGGTVSGNGTGIKLGPAPSPLSVPPTHDIQNLVARDNVEAGIRVAPSNGLRLRKSTITGGKIGVIALFGAANRIDLGRTDDAGANNFGGAANRSSQAAICAITTPAVAMPAVGNRFSDCTSFKNLADISTTAGCEAITGYADIWWRGLNPPDASSCTKGL